MNEFKELEKKAWYRFFKLCYVFAYFVSLAIAVARGYSEFPVEYVDSDGSIIQCANGVEYSARAISGYFTNNQLDSNDDVKARKLCSESIKDIPETTNIPSGDIVPESDLPIGVVPWTPPPNWTPPPKGITLDQALGFEKNYTFIPVKAVRGSYATLFWGLSIVVFVGEIIRRSFLYVVAGRPFYHGFTFIK